MNEVKIAKNQNLFGIGISEDEESTDVTDIRPFSLDVVENILWAKERPDLMHSTGEPSGILNTHTAKMAGLDQCLLLTFPLAMAQTGSQAGEEALREHPFSTKGGHLSGPDVLTISSIEIESFELASDVFESFSTVTSSEGELAGVQFLVPVTACSSVNMQNPWNDVASFQFNDTSLPRSQMHSREKTD